MAGIPGVARVSETVSATGTGTIATIGLESALDAAVGDRIVVSGIVPNGYNGKYTITAISNIAPFSVSYACTETGSQLTGGNVTTTSYSKVIATTGAYGNGQYATVYLAEAPNISIGATFTIADMTPNGYNGTHTAIVTSDNEPYSVSFASTTSGDQEDPGVFRVSDQPLFDTGDWGVVGTGFGSLSSRTRSNVEAALKNEVQNSASWGSASNILFGNGTLDSDLPFPVALLKGIGQAITRSAFMGANSVGDVLDAIDAWFDGFVGGSGGIIGDIGLGIVDGNKTMKQFLKDLWLAITGQEPVGDVTVDQVKNVLSGLTNTSNTANSNALTGISNAYEATELAEEVIASGSNLIINPSFERQRFEQAGSTFSTEQARSGNRSLKIVAEGFTPKSYTLLSDGATPRILTVTPDDVFYVEFYVRAKSTNSQTTGGSNAIRMLFEPYDKVNAPLAIASLNTSPANVSKTGWSKVSGYVNMPLDAARLKISIELSYGINANEVYYFDDVTVREVTLASAAAALAGTADTNATQAITNAYDVAELADDVVQAGSNIVVNPGFEKIRFQQFGSTFSTDYPRSGNRSLKITGVGSNTKSFELLSDGLTPRTLTVTEGDVFYAEIFVRGNPSNSQTSGGAGALKLLFEPFSKNGTSLAVSSFNATASTALNNDWTKLAGYVVMPTGAVKLRISIQVSGDVQDTDVYYFDDVTIREVTLAQNALATANTADANANTAISNAFDAADLADEIITTGSNVVINPGFEKLRFQQAGSTFSLDYSHSGTRSLKIVGDGVNGKSYTLLSDGGTPRTLVANEGDVFYGEIWVRGNPANTQTSGGFNAIKLLFEPFNKTGTALAVSSFNATASTALNSEWLKLSGYVIMPASAVKVKISVDVSPAVNAGETYYFDDIIIREVTLASTANATANTADANAATALVNAQSATDLAGEVIAAGNNIVKNPSFETGFFAQAGGTYSTDQARTGERSLKMTGAGIGTKKYTLLSDDSKFTFIPAAPGDVFYCEMFVRGKSSNTQTSGGTDAIKLVLEPYNGLAELATSSISTTASTALNSVWTKMSALVTMPANTTRVKISIQLTSAVSSSDIYYFDDVVIREVTLANTANTNAAGAQSTANTGVANAAAAQTTANTATTDLQTTVDSIVQSVDGGTSTGNAPVTARTKLRTAWANFWDGLNGSSGTTDKLPSDVRTAASSVRSTANTASTNATTANTSVQSTVDNIHQAVQGGSSTGNGLGTVRTNLRAAWANFWDGLNGSSGSSDKLPSDVLTAAASVRSTANTGVSNAATAQTTATTAKNLGNAANNRGANIIPNGGFESSSFALTGYGAVSYSTEQYRSGAQSLKIVATGTNNPFTYLVNSDTTSQKVVATAGEVFYLECYVYGKTTNTQTTGGTNGIYLALDSYTVGGTLISTGSVMQNASTALSGAWTKISGYVTLPTNTAYFMPYIQVRSNVIANETYYFDDVTVYRFTDTQNVIDNIVQAVDGGTATGAAPTAPRTKLRTAWANFWDGLNGSTGTSDKSPSDVLTAAASVRSTANTGVTNAATADAKAVKAEGLISTYVRSGNNMVLSGSFEDSNVTYSEQNGHVRSTDVARTGSYSLKSDVTALWKYSIVSRGPGGNLPMNVSPGDVLYTEAWVYGKTSNTQTSGGTNGLRIIIQWYTGANVYMGGDTTTVFGHPSTTYNGVWTKLSGYATVPAGASYAYMLIATDGAKITLGDIYYWDDCACYRTTEAVAAQSTANIATTNIQTTVDSIVQAVDGGTATGAAPATTRTKLRTAWANFWDGLNGSSGTTDKSPSDVLTAAASVRSTANTGVTNAATADAKAVTADGKAVTADGKAVTAQTTANTATTNLQTTVDSIVQSVDGGSATGAAPATAKTKLQNAWANFWDGLNGSSGTTSKLPSDVLTAGAAVRSQANLGVTNAATADAKAVTADGKAVTADGKAATADTKAQNTIDGIIQAVDGSTTTNSAPATAKTKLQSIWNNLWDGLNGSASQTATGKVVGDLFTIGSAARSRAELGITNASTADGKAVTADTKAQNTIDGIVQAVDGTTTTNSLPANAKTKLQLAWANLWDGLSGSQTATSTSKTAAELLQAGYAARSKANDAFTNAATADGKAVLAQTNIDLKAKDFLNIAAGSDFDSNTHPWTLQTGWSLATDQFKSGTQSLKNVSHTSGPTGALLNNDGRIEVKPGDQFYMEIWARRTTDCTQADSTGNSYRLRLVRAHTGSTIDNVYFAPVNLPDANTWLKLSNTITIPDDGTTGIYFRIHGLPANAPGAVWVDNIVIRRVATAEVVGTLPQGKVTNLTTDLSTNASNIQATVDGIVQAVDGGAATGATPATTKTKLQLAWANLWDGLSGSQTATSTSKTAAELLQAGYAARSKANDAFANAGTADSKAQNTLDNIVQAVDGTSNTGAVPGTAKTKLQQAWANIWDGLSGSASATQTSKLPADVLTAAYSTRSKANDAFTNAGTAQSAATVAQNTVDVRAKDFANLVAGSDFDAVICPWNMVTGYFELDTTQFNSGTKSLKITAGAVANNTTTYGNGSGLASYFEAKPGEQFYVEMWVRRSSDWTVPDASGPRFRIVRGNGPSAGTTFGNFVITAALLPDANKWEKISATFDMVNEAGVNSIAFMFTGPASTATGTLWVDDIVVRRVVVPDAVATLPQSKVTNLTSNLTTNSNNIQTTVDSIVQAVDGSSATGATPATTKTKLQLAWANLWDGLSGSQTATSTSKTAAELLQAGYAARSKANDAFSNAGTADGKAVAAQTAASEIAKASGTNMVTNSSFESAVGTNVGNGSRSTDYARTGSYSLRLTSNGTSNQACYVFASTVDNTLIRKPCVPGDVYYIEAWVRGNGTTDNGRPVNTATTGSVYISSEFNTGSVSSPTYSYVAPSSLNASPATIGTTNFYKLSGYVTAPANAITFMPILVVGSNVANNNTFYWDDVVVREVTTAVSAVDSIVQAVDGSSTTGNAPSAAKTKLQLAWANLWDGLSGSQTATSTSKTAAELLQAGYAARSKANDAFANAGTAQTTANTAQSTANAVAASANLCISPNFEDSTILRPKYGNTAAVTLTYTNAQKFQGTQSLSWTHAASTWSGPVLAPISSSTTSSATRYMTKAGDTFNVKVKIMPAAGNNTTVGFVGLWLRWVNTATNGTSDSTTTIQNSALASGWQDLNRVATCPAGYDALEVFVLSSDTTTANNTYYIDAVSIREESTAQTTIDSIVQAVDGSSTTGSAATAAKTKLQLAWANLWDGLSGAQTASSTSKLPADLLTAAYTTRSKANDAFTNAGTADGKAVIAQSMASEITKSGNNLASNPGFENGNFYINSSVSYNTDTAFVRNGSRSLKAVSDGTNYKGTSAFCSNTAELWMPCAAGDVYYMEAWVYAPTANTATTGSVYIQLAVRVGTSASYTTSYITIASSTPAPLEGVWTKLSGYATIPANAFEFVAVCYVHANTPTGNTFYWDDVIVREVTVASQATNRLNNTISSGANLATNLGFEDTGQYIGTDGTYVTTPVRTGSRSVQVIANGTSTKTVPLFTDYSKNLTVSCTPGDVFSCEAWVYGKSTNTQFVYRDFSLSLTQNYSVTVTKNYTITLTGVTSGNYTLTYNGTTSASIAWNASAATVLAAIQGLAGSATVTVTGSGPYTVTITGIGTTLTATSVNLNGTIAVSAVGSFTMSYGGQTTIGTSYSATATTIQTNLRALTTVTGTNATVTATTHGFNVTIAGANALTGTNVTGGTIAVPTQTGTYTLTYNGVTTADITYTSANTVVKSRLEALAGVGTATVTATLTGFTIGLLNKTSTLTGANVSNGTVSISTAASSTDGYIELDILGFSESGTSVAIPAVVQTAADTPLKNTWTKLAANWVVPAGCYSFRPVLTVGSTVVNNETFYFDDPAIREITAQSAADEINSSIITTLGSDESASGSAAVLAALEKTSSELAAHTKAIQELQVTKQSGVSRGGSWSIDFSDFATVTAAGFSLAYLPTTGANTIVINNGIAQWNVADNNNRDATLIYQTSTLTDFQSVRGTMSAPPQAPSGTTPYFYALARVSPDGLYYVWARAYALAFGSYRADFGYCLNGTEYTWRTGVVLKWSLDMRFVAGVGTNAREYQIWSGNSIVDTYTESTIVSRLCSNSAHTSPSQHDTSCTKFRQWGAKAQVRNGKVAGKVESVAVADNGTPSVNGSVARMTKTTGTRNYVGGNTITPLDSSFFDTIPHESLDIDAVASDGTFKVTEAKPYVITARVSLGSNVSALGSLVLQKSTDNVNWTTVQYGASVHSGNGESLQGNWLQYLEANEFVRLAYTRTGITVNNALTGSGDGAQTFFAIAGCEGAG